MTIETVGVVISIIVAIVGLIINIAAVGIYIGRLDGFKDLVNFKFDLANERVAWECILVRDDHFHRLDGTIVKRIRTDVWDA